MNHFRFIPAVALLILGASGAYSLNFGDDSKQQRLRMPKAFAKAAVPNTKAYGWLLRDRGTLEKGLVEMTMDTPDKITQLHKLADKAWAGAFADGAYYFYRYKDDAANENWIPIAFSKVDIASGKITDIASWADKLFISNDMTYDYSSGTMYALSREIYQDDFLSALTFEYSGLYKIDLATGAATQVKQFINWNSGALANPTYLTLAADLDGNIYSIDINGILYRFDRDNDWEAIMIGDTGRRPTTSIQSMDFDPSTGKIFWAADYKSQVADFCMVDPSTGATEVVGPLGTDSRICGLHIDFRIPKEGAPAGVTDLNITTSTQGECKADISWTNPTKTFGKANLASLTKVRLLRDGTQVAEWNSPSAGSSLSFTDTPSAPRFHTYSVVAANALGDGLEHKATAWIGRDVPDAVGKPGVGRNDDGSAVLQWETPAGGLHGGWIDRTSLRYRITRLPDRKIVEPQASGNEFIDTSITSMGKYSYEIVPYTSDGDGMAASTVEIALGNEITSFPYNCVFEDSSVFDTWTVINANGGSTWGWKKRGLSDFDAFAMYQYDNNNSGDDYLISPVMRLQKGKEYTLRFNYRGSNANHTEKFEVVFGREATKEGMSTILKSYQVKTGDGAYDTLTLPEITEDGTYRIGFHATSDPKMYNLYITGITIAQAGAPEPPAPGELPPPYDLKAFVNAKENRVTLTWNHNLSTQDPEEGLTVPVIEDFESYPEWVVNPTGKYDWHYIDADGGIPYRSDYDNMPYPTDGHPCAAMIMAPYELSKQIYEPNPPHSGDKYLLFKSNFSAGDGSRPAPAPEDYFISPKLNYTSDFVFSFWCKADPDWEAANEGFSGEDIWNRENFRVGYSTGGRNATDFTWFTDTDEQVISTGTSWTKKEYAVPANAKYVCIKYCTPQNGFWFMVDDVYIGPPQNTGAPRLLAGQEPVFKTFDVYLDEKKVMTTTGNSHELLQVSQGNHNAKVIAVYEEGESEPAEISFTLDPAAIDVILAQAVHIDVYTLDGLRIQEKATQQDINQLPAGIYILKTGKHTFKIHKD